MESLGTAKPQLGEPDSGSFCYLRYLTDEIKQEKLACGQESRKRKLGWHNLTGPSTTEPGQGDRWTEFFLLVPMGTPKLLHVYERLKAIDEEVNGEFGRRGTEVNLTRHDESSGDREKDSSLMSPILQSRSRGLPLPEGGARGASNVPQHLSVCWKMEPGRRHLHCQCRPWIRLSSSRAPLD